MATVLAAKKYEEEILRSLRRIMRAVDIYSRKLASQHQLTGPQLICLRQLIGQGSMSTGSLAMQMTLSPATVTGILDRLEQRGLVSRERRPEDKRLIMVTATDAGRELAGQAPMPLHESFSRRLAKLPEDRQAEIERVLREVVEMMEAESIDAAALLTSGPADADSENVSAFLGEPDTPEPDRN